PTPLSIDDHVPGAAVGRRQSHDRAHARQIEPVVVEALYEGVQGGRGGARDSAGRRRAHVMLLTLASPQAARVRRTGASVPSISAASLSASGASSVLVVTLIAGWE